MTMSCVVAGEQTQLELGAVSKIRVAATETEFASASNAHRLAVAVPSFAGF
ncbi:hypothetical protein SPRG_17847 [Saprolegnia parasitica CBS 223.65]|uniref:Uncharacterized protein n=1 Tax=Saprolegnia parasitica (strain CBS 223.65) TaxID=695850 RepID=A0A067BPP1_SAPPC|nr:hypothetical protein SPRG_17847 [Saprolegnia parasitica CBS 223.65]KDO16657.1 hypothetical protein SPRG_17847 [Saprolegnia parasitica CBS 223.65]|eukprot:XP_012212635.1 hypothetical protein SPRG_17847 [Saprolegnia parasitica CBS 223.65]